MKKKCPECGGETFYVSALVTQDWKMDYNGDYLETMDDCIDVTHYPCDDDVWDCANCSYSAIGAEFNI